MWPTGRPRWRDAQRAATCRLTRYELVTNSMLGYQVPSPDATKTPLYMALASSSSFLSAVASASPVLWFRKLAWRRAATWP